jgi:hypothetical protein
VTRFDSSESVQSICHRRQQSSTMMFIESRQTTIRVLSPLKHVIESVSLIQNEHSMFAYGSRFVHVRCLDNQLGHDRAQHP